MPMKIYNTLTRQKEEFVPLEPGVGQNLLPAAPRYTTSSISATPAPCACSTCCAVTWNTGAMR